MYLAVFISSLAVDLVPVFAPPAWTLMVLFVVKFHLNPWLVLAVGVPGSALGRCIFTIYIPRVADHLIKRQKKEDLEFIGQKLDNKLWQSWAFVFAYTLTPLSTTALFTATGMAKLNPLQIIPPFLAGKFISDAFMIFTGRFAVTNAGTFFHGIFSVKGLTMSLVGLLLIGAVMFLDWRLFLDKKKSTLISRSGSEVVDFSA